LLISFIASTLGAISGIGGGVIIKPSLDTFSSLNVSVISFLSSCTVLSMSTVAMIRNSSRRRSIKLETRVSLLLAGGGILGGLLGKHLFDMIRAATESDRLLGSLQSGILGAMVLGVLFYTVYKENFSGRHIHAVVPTVLAGMVLGGIATFLGIGGGPVNIVVLSYFFNMNSKQAAFNSLFIIFLSQIASLIYTILQGIVPDVSLWILILMITGGILGGLTGSFIIHLVSLRALDKIFSIMLFMILVMSVFNLYRFLG
jgi:uncharacterized membrane protein YfcA